MRQLVEDTTLRSKMGEYAREHARGHFDLDQMAKAYLRLYEHGARKFLDGTT